MSRFLVRLLITGGCGFIGSNLVQRLCQSTDWSIWNIDRLSYASNRLPIAESDRYRFVHADILDANRIAQVFREFRPEIVLHLAAETHVDRSIDDPHAFIHTNVLGTIGLLEACRNFSENNPQSPVPEFVHVSTDEVFGSIPSDQMADPETRFSPRSPYSASKAAADHFVSAWRSTYGLSTSIIRLSNVYGPRQFPEKLIPLAIIKAIRGEPIPIYGNGSNERDWLYVEDACEGIQAVLEHQSNRGKVFHLSTQRITSNIELVRLLCEEIDRNQVSAARSAAELITFVDDRPGHDQRYSLCSEQTSLELNWGPKIQLQEGLRRTVHWYLQNREWWEEVLRTRYNLERLGIAKRMPQATTFVS